MMLPSRPVKVLVATRPVDFRKGMDGLAALVQEYLKDEPFSGAVFVFRAKRADKSSWCGGTVRVSVSLPSGWSRAGSGGPGSKTGSSASRRRHSQR